MAAGLQGCEDFNVYVYRARYADIRAAFGDDLAAIYQHYLKYGIREKRSGSGPMPEIEGVTVKDGIDYSAVYNYQYYIDRYPDIKAAFGDDDVAVLDHFVRYGMNEQRQAIGSFNVVSYRNAYQDLRRAFGTNWKDYYLHYIKYGYKENRMTTGVATLQNPVTVYKQTDFSEIYDYYYYSSQHPKIAAALSYDDSLLLDYFVRNGLSSGQAGKASYDQAKYDEIKKKFPAYEYPKAAAVLAQVGKDLHSAFDWSKKLDYDRRGLPADGSPGTNYFAEYGFDHLYGNCYVYAATFVQMARLLGYDARQVSGGVMRPDESYADHSWVEIDEGDVTYVYDPEFEWQYGRDGFRMVYGQAERWVYKIYSYMTDEPEQK